VRSALPATGTRPAATLAPVPRRRCGLPIRTSQLLQIPRAEITLAPSRIKIGKAVVNDQNSEVLSDDERAIAQRLIDEINEFNLKATGIAEFHEMLIVENDDDGELIARVYRWSWGGMCWIEALWVREDMRHRGVGTRLLAAAEKEARRHGCAQLGLDTHTFQAASFYERQGFEAVGELPDYPRGHSKLLLRKQLPD